MFFHFFFSLCLRNSGRNLSVRVAAFGINFERWFMLHGKEVVLMTSVGLNSKWLPFL